MRSLTVALVGNPNSGKTTLFNFLTGSKQYVGNRPGVTVEEKEGKIKSAKKLGYDITLVDLPGIYSLSPYSMEEVVAREYVINEKPDAVINIVDATNIERNLYLSIQLIELERPVVIALNMMDEVNSRGDMIDVERLSKELNLPIVPITAKTGEGTDELINTLIDSVKFGSVTEPDDLYDDYTHSIHHRIDELIWKYAVAKKIPVHWASIKMLEGDALLEKTLELPEDVLRKIESIVKEYENSKELGDRETMVADSRYKYIEKIIRKSVVKSSRTGKKTITEKIDNIVTNRILAIPIFLLIMFVVFNLTFSSLGALLQGFIELLIEQFSAAVEKGLIYVNAAEWITSLVVDGVIAGVGGVLTFLPQIAILFCLLSVIEDTGYMSRIAFIMDRLLRRFGLSGKAFIPMLMGFGCTVPAVMSARTMDNIKDKRLTILLIPFMSCSAKLPIYGFLASAFFEKHQGLVVFSLYILGIILGIFSGILFKNTLFKDNDAPFVMELPPYRMPGIKNTLLHVWEKVEHFVKKAATLIFGMTVIIWFLQNFNFKLQYVKEGQSMLGFIGQLIAPVFKPLGFGTWQASVALITGIIAKEAVVSTISMLYGIASSGGVAQALAGTFSSPEAAYSFLVFTLLYVPCVAAISTMKKELNSVKWLLFSLGYQLLVAYAAALIAYSIGSLL